MTSVADDTIVDDDLCCRRLSRYWSLKVHVAFWTLLGIVVTFECKWLWTSILLDPVERDENWKKMSLPDDHHECSNF